VLVWSSQRYTGIEEKQTEFETENNNTADNASINQSQARDSRYRQMQKLNSLCVSK